MNLRKIYNIIEEGYRNFDFSIEEETKDYVCARADISLNNGIDDELLIELYIREDSLNAYFTFDRIDKKLKVYDLINDFNEAMPYFKGYINGDDFLCITSRAEGIPNEEGYLLTFNYMIELLFGEESMKYLSPLCSLTY